MLPLGLLNASAGQPMMVELKSGESYNGHLVNCDNWMNINLKDVICTSADGDRFWKISEAYIRGSVIKYLRIPEEVLDKVKEKSANNSSNNNERTSQRGGRGGQRGGRRGGSSRN
ncbi:RNA processing protein [Clydaea vesicula]|uniref:LSM complex subunit LSM4 n=1 Tax=Clydaea vesicula TaxID=447962 RepID=A0AAD5TX73_9FUNG|nr:RNA processing protein [Clydaea vesicula]KAJ3378920.1 RNA processing protein [Lobulomyces angularis]